MRRFSLIIFFLLALTSVLLPTSVLSTDLAKPKENISSRSKIEFLSNRFLIRLKPTASQTLRSKANENPNTSISSLGLSEFDQILVKHQVQEIKPLVKVVKYQAQANQTNSPANLLDRTATVTLNSEQKVLSSEGMSKQKILTNPEYKKLFAAMADFKKSSDVELVEPDLVYKTTSTPNDYYLSSPGNNLWNLKNVNAEQAWDKTVGSENVVVAISDTGVDYTHPDMASNIWTNPGESGLDGGGNDKKTNNIDDDQNGYIDDWRGWNFVSQNNDPMDNNGHGTHVGGIVGAVGNNDSDHSQDSGKRVVGVNQQVALMPVKSGNNVGVFLLSDAISGILYSADNGASVVNLSWGGLGITSEFLSAALGYGYESNMVIVAAAGNSLIDASLFNPANSPFVITVGSANEFNNVSCFSNFGSKIDLIAPGGDVYWCAGSGRGVLSTRSSQTAWYYPAGFEGNNYMLLNGTSMASPHVAGTAALIRALHPDFSIEEIRHILRNSADNVLNQQWGTKFGFGRLNANNALEANFYPPTVKISSPTHHQTFNGSSIAISGSALFRGQALTWKLEVGTGENPTSWQTISEGSSEVNNAALGTLDLTSYATDSLIIKLSATGQDKTSEDRVEVFFDKELAANWPKSLPQSDFFLNTEPVVVDLTGDGIMEIISSGDIFDDKIYAYKLDGSSLPGWPITLSDSGVGAPTAVDLNNDGKAEIIVSYGFFDPAGGKLAIYKFDGTLLPGWPKSFPIQSIASPAVGNMLGNTTRQIVYDNCGIHVLSLDGTDTPGWSNSYSCPAEFVLYNSPTVVDFNSDGLNEVAVVDPWIRKLSVYNNDGSLRFQKDLLPDPLHYGQEIKGPTAADLNGDNQIELIMGVPFADGHLAGCPGSNLLECYKANLEIIDQNGNNYPNWPKTILNNQLYGSVSVADLNIDGTPEILVPGFPNQRVFSADGSDYLGGVLPIWTFYTTGSPPTFADYDNDGKPEVVSAGGETVSSDLGYIDLSKLGFFIQKDGSTVWKRYLFSLANSAPTVGDFDKNGKLDIVGTTMDLIDGTGRIYLWKTERPTISAGNPLWTQAGGNARHTKSYVFNATPCMGYGDISLDGKVNSDDATDALRITVGLPQLNGLPYSQEQIRRADTNGSGAVTSTDSLHINRYISGRQSIFPVCP